jgi:hypothetical protein
VWVSAAFAAKALEPVERAVNRVTNWWRPLVACPHCNEAMTRRGHDMVPFQGCDEHGYWIDDENVGQTGLARRAFAPLLDAARKHARAFADELKHAELAEQNANDSRNANAKHVGPRSSTKSARRLWLQHVLRRRSASPASLLASRISISCEPRSTVATRCRLPSGS